MNPEVYLRLAADRAAEITKAIKQEFNLAAVGIRSDGVIVCTTNKAARAETTPGVVPARLWNSHAEARLCRKLDYGTTVCVARVTRDGRWAMSKPCPNCERLLRKRNVKRIYYTIGPNEYGSLIL